jgi:hypothetical protein
MVEGDLEEHFLYLVHNKDACFYVGQSVDPINRIHQHLAIPSAKWAQLYPSLLGKLIKDNAPESYDWTVEFYNFEDFNMHNVPELTRKSTINLLEEILIEQTKPCLNVIGRNYHNPLPDKYQKHKIANKGVKLNR